MIHHIARILEQGRREEMTMKKLYTMSAKVARRIMKLDNIRSTQILDFAKTQVSTCRKHLLVTWAGVQAAGSTAMEPVPLANIIS